MVHAIRGFLFGGPAAKISICLNPQLFAGSAAHATCAPSLKNKIRGCRGSRGHVDGSGRDVGVMRRATVEAAEVELERPDLAEALGGWMQGVHEVLD